MPRKPNEGRLYLDMPLGEALDRLIGTKPSELEAAVKASKAKKPPDGKKKPPSGKRPKAQNVVSLRARRARKHNTGRA